MNDTNTNHNFNPGEVLRLKHNGQTYCWMVTGNHLGALGQGSLVTISRTVREAAGLTEKKGTP